MPVRPHMNHETILYTQTCADCGAATHTYVERHTPHGANDVHAP
jgi:hypothetical protein